MAKQLFANNASSLLAASIDDVDTTIQVSSGFGTLYPDPSTSDWFLVALENADGDIEICRCTARTGDLLTVTRGQEGTVAQSWTNGQARVECRVTKETLEQFIQRTGDFMEGDLDLDSNDITNAHLTGSDTKILAGEIVNVPLRGVSGDASNQIAVPTDGSRVTAGGDPILTDGDDLFEENFVFPAGMIMAWFGSLLNIPSGWAVCDGTNGTPDLRGRMILGVDGSHAFDSNGGAETASGDTSAAGGHTPTGEAAGHALTEDELPAHRHFVSSNATYSGSGNQDVSALNQIGRAHV